MMSKPWPRWTGCPGRSWYGSAGADGLVDGYVLQYVDASARTAVYIWVRRGKPDSVAAYLLELLAEVCPKEGS